MCELLWRSLDSHARSVILKMIILALTLRNGCASTRGTKEPE